MERVWDYFMRRKGLLALVLLISATGSFFSYRMLDQSRQRLNHTYITISNWGDEAPEVTIPLTGGESSLPTFSVMPPREVVRIFSADSEIIEQDIPEESNEANSSEPSIEEAPTSEPTPADIAIALGEPIANNESSSEDLPDSTPEVAVPDLGMSTADSSDCKTSLNPSLIISLLATLLVLGYFTYQHYRR